MRRALAFLLVASAVTAVAADTNALRPHVDALVRHVNGVTAGVPVARAEPSGVVERIAPAVAAASARVSANVSDGNIEPRSAVENDIESPDGMPVSDVTATGSDARSGNDGADEPLNLKDMDDEQLNAALLDDGDAAAMEDPAPASAPPADAETKLVSVARETWVMAQPRWRSRKLGYLRAGAVVARQASEVGRQGCKGGWYRVHPRGFVCKGKAASTDVDHPVAQLSHKRPDLSGLPYTYVTSRYPTPPLYARLPTLKQQRKVEPRRAYHIRKDLQLSKAAGYVAPPPAEPLPEWLAQGKVLPGLGGVDRGPNRVTLGNARVRSGFALLGTYEHEGRRFGLTTELALLPLDRVRVVRPSTLQGVVLSDEFSLPAAMVRSKHARRYQTHGPGGPLALAGHFKWREVLPLTGRRKSRGADTFYELKDGSWVHADSVARLSKYKRAPRWAKRGKKWIDVSLLRQTLVAYEGTRPVYATIVSTGAGGIGDPEKTHATVQGTFLIHTKHTTVTMDGDEQGDEFDLRDVPYVQYFSEGYALHAAYWHDDFGVPRSHGCVNLAPRDAAWLFNWTEPTVPDGWHAALSLKKGTIVYVHP